MWWWIGGIVLAINIGAIVFMYKLRCTRSDCANCELFINGCVQKYDTGKEIK